MTPLEEVETIQTECEKFTATDNAIACIEMMDWSAVQIARVTKMLANAKKALSTQTKQVAQGINEPSMYSATMFKALVATGVAEEQYLVDRLEGVLKALNKKFDSCQSAAAYARSEQSRLPKT